MPTIYNATSIRQRPPEPEPEPEGPPRSDRDQRIVDLLAKGFNRRQIGEFVGLTTTGVREALKRMELIA